MSDKSINSLLGSLSTKELPGTGRLKSTNSSISEHHDNDRFHARLLNSMENTQTSDEQTATYNPSESANIKDTDDINHRREPLSLEIKVNQTAKTDGDHTQLNPEINQKINENEFTNGIINKVSNQKISTAQIMANTLLETPHLNNPELKSPGGANLNIAQKQTGDLIPEPAVPLSDKLSTTQATTNMAQQIPGDIEQELLQTTLSDKLNTALSNTKISDQKIVDIITNPGLSETAKVSGVESAILQQSRLSASHATTPSENILSENKDNIKGIQNPVPAIEKAGSKNISLSASSHTDESGNNKIDEMLKEQHQNKPLSSTADRNLQTQHLVQAQIESEETPETFEARANTTESKPTKLFDNTTLTSNSNVNTVGAAMQSNTSSDNPTFNNQGAQNPVPAIEKAGSEIINLNTSSQTDESGNNKTDEMLKEQHQNKSLSSTTDKNLQAQIESEEAPETFEARANTTESKPTKLLDNTTLTSNSNVNTVGAAMQSNTSSDNSAFNNQGTDTNNNFSSNTVNNNQKIRPETNFNNTLLQVNSAANPLGIIGNDVADNIVQSAKLYTQGGTSEVKVQLSPPELGTIKLEFKVEDDVLETKITVERSSVKDAIEKDIPRLRELISNAGIDVGKLDVSLQDKENNKMDFMNKNFHPDSKNKSTQNFLQQESEYHEDNLVEEAMPNNTEPTQINYLV
ncbi:MAG: flagellar hook-length control protein FliK [Candidatus Scalindua rubra]|uniref:Flagellar hook-length control protein n=1 Tax=Candidatus Scalindua brodae TaxID=237368 RepID=A0A0B0EK69_9BACT|nr:MAG: flagellar hook-length control protein [Candidatus Scalindua brodae]MBZ0108309.1 flagellar hook-length control protein FliK [Candidatus Scalindua rubra]TWU34006.1 Flagellar hook-length control protein FliK [Candidatus Brocadiaceae bacterium S225]